MYEAQVDFYFDPNDICSLCYGSVNTNFVLPFSEHSITVPSDVSKTYLLYPCFSATTSVRIKLLVLEWKVQPKISKK